MGRRTKRFSQLERDVIAATRTKLGSDEYVWLKEFTATHEIDVHNLINYGCNIGAETFALVVEFTLQLAVGVDANLDSLKQGQALVGGATTGDTAIIKHDAIIAFVGSDIVEGLGVRGGHFDFGYCKNVLDKVIGNAVGLPIEDLRRAVAEMARIIRPGGIVVVEGEVANKAGESLDLNSLFRELRMEPLPVSNDDEGARRAYRKQDV